MINAQTTETVKTSPPPAVQSTPSDPVPQPIGTPNQPSQNPQLPSVNQMASDLQPATPQPPTTVQSVANNIEGEPANNTLLDNENKPILRNKPGRRWSKLFLQHPVRNIVAVGLTAQGLFGIYKSVMFILNDLPQMEQQLNTGLITQTDANQIAAKAVMIVISTVLSMFFAMRLTVLKSKAAKGLNTIIAILLFLGNAYIFGFLDKVPLIDEWGSITDTVLNKITEIFAILKLEAK